MAILPSALNRTKHNVHNQKTNHPCSISLYASVRNTSMKHMYQANGQRMMLSHILMALIHEQEYHANWHLGFACTSCY